MLRDRYPSELSIVNWRDTQPQHTGSVGDRVDPCDSEWSPRRSGIPSQLSLTTLHP